jgi:cell division protein FtsQ
MTRERNGAHPAARPVWVRVPLLAGALGAAMRSLRPGAWRAKAPQRLLPSPRRLIAIFIASFVIAAAVAVVSGSDGSPGQELRLALADVAARAGFVVKDVFVVGRQDTPKADILDAMGVKQGEPIFALDLDAMRERVLALPWVGEASVERQLPNTLLVQISERHPAALWQNHGRFAVINEHGEVLSSDDVAAYSDLLIVVGNDAPQHTAALLHMLASQPELAQRVHAAVRVGGRRWDVMLNGDIDVRLPENGAEDAWRRLAEYQREHDLLDKPLAGIDLRLPDRIVVQRAAPPPQTGSGGHGRDA